MREALEQFAQRLEKGGPEPLRQDGAEAILAEYEREDREAVERARAAHRPLPPGATDIGAVGEEFLERAIEICPSVAQYVVPHAHAALWSAPTVAANARWILLAEDTRHRIARWKLAEHGSPAERTTAIALEAACRASLERPGDLDEERVRFALQIDQSFPDSSACPACGPTRCAIAAAEHFESASNAVLESVLAIRKAPRVLARAAAQRVAWYADLEGTADAAFPGADEDARGRLRAACEAAQDRFERAAAWLETQVLPAASSSSASARADFASGVRLDLVDGSSPSGILRDALDEIDRTNAELRRIEASGTFRRDGPAPREIRHAEVASEVSLALERVYGVAPETADETVDDVDDVSHVDPLDAHLERIRARHAWAAGLGGRLTFGLRQSAGPLRSSLWTTSFCHGWIERSVELLAELEDGDALDVWQLAFRRRDLAWKAALDVAVHCGELDPNALAEWADEDEGALPLWDWTWEAVSDPGLGALRFAGVRSLRLIEERARERQGADFDAPRFRTEFLRRGPLSPALIERELLS